MAGKRENFGSKMAVMFAMAGSAIGLGNIWRFPYMVGEHGGGAFVLIYILATLLVSLPVFIAEVTIGRRSGTSSYNSMAVLSDKNRRLWKAVGLVSVGIPLLICSYYSVIGGWSIEYLAMGFHGVYANTPAEVVPEYFNMFISSTWGPLVTFLLFLGLSCLVVRLGVNNGIEIFNKYSIPILFILIVAMMVYALCLPGAGEGVKYYIVPDFDSTGPSALAYALGQSFYSLSLGTGVIVTYGSYVKKNDNIVSSSAGTAVFDLMFALIAGMVIMPAVFAAGIAPGTGPGLIFESIPYIFCRMAESYRILGLIVPVIFFLTIVIAAITSSISMLEVGASFLTERFGWSRRKSVPVLFVVCSCFGIIFSMSFGVLSNVTIFGENIFGAMDALCSNFLMLFLALLNVIFVGFVLRKEDVRDEITNSGKMNTKVFPIIYFLIKWVAPVAMVTIFVTNFIL